MAKTENTEATEGGKDPVSREQTIYLIVRDAQGRITQDDVKNGVLEIVDVTRNAQVVMNAALSGDVDGVVLSFKGKVSR